MDEEGGNGSSSYHHFISASASSSSFTRRPYGKKERIQREIIVMLHVQKCSELEQEPQTRTQTVLCAVPHCPKMKRTLIHVAMCQGDGCRFPECDVTRTIIQHWIRCPKRRCTICSPVLDSIPALDGGSHYEMDDKLLALLYTSTNGLIDIVSSDLSSLTDETANSPQNIHAKRKFTPDVTCLTASSPPSNDIGWDKKRRTD